MAIILLIAVPKISNVIDNVKKGAFLSSVSMIVKAAEYKSVNTDLTNIDLTTLEYDGKRYENGRINLNEKGQIEAYIWNEQLNLCAVKRYENSAVTINNLLDEASCVGGTPAIVDLDSSNPTYPCYTFDSITGTIEAYDHTNPSCPTDFYAPTSIDGVNVLIIGDGNDSIGSENLTSVDLNDAIYLEKISDYAFAHQNGYTVSKITSLTFPDSNTLKYIGNRSFSKTNISSLDIPEGVTYLSGFEITKINEITIPSSTTIIGNFAFYGNQISSVTIPVNVLEIKEGAFASNNITTVVIPNGTKILGDECFSWNPLTSITLPNSIEYLSGLGYTDLPSVNIPTSVKEIGTAAFSGIPVTNLIIPNGVTSIGDSAFSGAGIQTVVIPNTVTYIGEDAFNNNSLTSLVIPSSVTEIAYGAFRYNSLTSITFNTPDVILEQMVADYGWNNYLEDAYSAGGAGTYTGTQNGIWTKN